MPVYKHSSQPVPYTSSPGRLALQDLWLFVRITLVWPITDSLPSIVLPFYPFRSGPLDELYPSPQNLWALSLHIFLIFTQATFLLLLVPSVLLGLPVPLLGWTPSCILVVVGFVVGNGYFCILLNGTKRRYESITDPEWQEAWQKRDDEKWVFINGVAAGDHWMQTNLDRLALTFRRPVHGIHNKTRGILFDTIECVVQRTFGYATPDIREIYSDVCNFIEEESEQAYRYKKIVIILHSQGAIEGGTVLDWLYANTDRELLKKVEVYTFGSAANHFNSPEDTKGNRTVKHIEHYANLGDWVSLFGILHFRPLPKPGKNPYSSKQARKEMENRYVGRLFVRKGSGHQMNGNYLDYYFPMSTDDKDRLVAVKDDNDFMSSELNEQILADCDIASKVSEKDVWDCSPRGQHCEDARQIKDVSRLWRYRNGMSPEE
ncbi:hypothetical protein LTR70_010321 [Exophiala xenobiotica]|uniref:Uncharacterized protein n=1 Tax=Lithohypha guttulata TaxID=1690604 RepID=A0ABR0JU64_9EURO|nr:hypothetical protein LTR24_010386 [Lithohypha guttulata]KAK5309395.1 hypothetical protein LTR70_010321 [Exophiala xenobiotica]